ncbi:MAG: molybdopterin-dependent oxidoreductase [Lentisphaerae bacterium]|nr:molybdopterin-dependent oxidoreductase [Lentisphaerota bacterium]MBT4814855.1 molybdopterin-dependent oxidoreductase [Lentisphaerota bacterium]MBT5612637.1 molybdopterin-dependent oxidoreductase [Lentisphaerota bacterium]MBT7057358.1 molybdopterin-dependent oxidoreductase [Lentisphaerota bacterium]MBT7846456.1 molybdopterin-dependent oxidoreductase [Lentisphaerota bacterium]
MDVKHASCYFCTSKGCAMKVHVENDQVQRVVVDTDAPVGPGTFCVRPTLAKEYQEHPFRLSFPMKRRGPRGADQWEQISWDQALNEISAKLAAIREEYGPEAVATSSGTGRGAAEFAKTRFMNLFGSPNRFGVISICYAPRAMVWFATFGGHLVPDVRPGTTKLNVQWGRNAHEGGRSSWNSFLKAKAAGMRTMVVDPRCSEPARQADCWVQLRPGSDLLLAMTMMQVIVEEDLYDKAFIESHTVGFEQLRSRLLQFTPEAVSERIGLSPTRLREVARFFAANQPSTTVIGVATEHSAPNGIQAVRAINLLRAICGTVDVPGGDLISSPCPGFLPDVVLEANELLTAEQRAKQLGSDRFRFLGYPGWELIEKNMRRKWGERHSAAVNLHSCAHAPTVFRAMLTGKPYPIKAALVSCSNPLLSYANTHLVHDALMATDLLVTFDITWTPTAQISDYVLPAACWMERPDMGNFASVGGYPLVQLGEAAVPAVVPGRYERLNDYDFWRALGLRLGQADHWPWETFEDLWEYRIQEILDECGYDSFEEFIEKRRWVVHPPTPGHCAAKGGLGTPSGKIELWSSILEDLGYDPLPNYVEPDIPAEVSRKYPLLNISGVRVMPYHHSEFRHVEGFRRQQRDPIVELHVDLARRKGINDGDWVWIESPRGRVRQRARLSTAFDPKCVVTQHAWWFPEQDGAAPCLHGLWQSNINVTTDDDPDMCDPLSGGWPLKGEYLRCTVSKAPSPTETPE